MAGNEAVRAKLSGLPQAPRPSPAPAAARPTPIAAVPGASVPGAGAPGVEFDALDRAADDIRPSWHAAAPVAAPLPAPPSGLSTSISGVQPSPLVEPAPAPAVGAPASGEVPASATPTPAPAAAPLTSRAEAALYYGSDPTPRGADVTQPMPPILLPSPWAQLSGHPLVGRLLDWRAQHPRLALGIAAALTLVLLGMLWPSSRASLPPPPLPAAPQLAQQPQAPTEPTPENAVEAAAPEAPADATPAPKAARKATKRREPTRPGAAKAQATKPAALIAKPAPKKAVEPAKSAKARGSLAPNPYP